MEYWYDGSTLSDDQWDRWMARNRGLSAFGALPGLPAGLVQAAAGNLAWQATPFDTPNLRRDNLFVRLAWQPDHWLLSADALVTPADRGRIVTLGVQWQGDRLRLNAVWRAYGGPGELVVRAVAATPRRRAGGGVGVLEDQRGERAATCVTTRSRRARDTPAISRRSPRPRAPWARRTWRRSCWP